MSLNNIRYLLLQSLSSLFSKYSSTYNYKIMTAIAEELAGLEDSIESERLASTVSTALSGDLDLHGKTFNLLRNFGELDESYRQRLLNAYDRGNVTYNNLVNLITPYSEFPIIGYQYVQDRWWLGGKYTTPKAVENVSSITGTIVHASSGVLDRTIPECWLETDTTRTGTNFASGASFINTPPSGADITLTTPVSAGVGLTLIYNVDQDISTDYTYDEIAHSFLNNDTIVRHRSLVNNFILVESTPVHVKVRTNMLPGYVVHISYYDPDVGTVYQWEATIEEDKTFTIDETKRLDNLIVDEYSLPDELTKVTTGFEVGNVVGIFLSTDVRKIGTNYSTSNNFIGKTITLDTTLPFKTGVVTTYNKYHIPDYSKLNFSQFLNAGDDDFRFTLRFNVWETFLKYGTFQYATKKWGQFDNPSAILIGELIDISKAAGIKTNIAVLTSEVKYGFRWSIYAEVFYSGNYFT